VIARPQPKGALATLTIEFELLEAAAVDYTRLPGAADRCPPTDGCLASDLTIAMALCVLKGDRAFSYAGQHRRPCLVATIRPQARPPMVLLDVDHGDDVPLSSMLLTFHRPVPFREMEAPIKALLDRLVVNSGRWDPSVLEPFADACGYVRLPRVLRHQKRMGSGRLSQGLGYAPDRPAGGGGIKLSALLGPSHSLDATSSQRPQPSAPQLLQSTIFKVI
jgi:hypothetical protein